MSRLTVLIVVIVIILAALFLFSTRAHQVPTKTIEVPVSQGGNAQ